MTHEGLAGDKTKGHTHYKKRTQRYGNSILFHISCFYFPKEIIGHMAR